MTQFEILSLDFCSISLKWTMRIDINNNETTISITAKDAKDILDFIGNDKTDIIFCNQYKTVHYSFD